MNMRNGAAANRLQMARGSLQLLARIVVGVTGHPTHPTKEGPPLGAPLGFAVGDSY